MAKDVTFANGFTNSSFDTPLLLYSTNAHSGHGSKTTENCFILFLRSLKTFHLGSFCSFEQPFTIRGMGLSCVYTLLTKYTCGRNDPPENCLLLN